MKLEHIMKLVIINNYASLTQNSYCYAVEFQENIANDVKDKYRPDENDKRHNRSRFSQN